MKSKWRQRRREGKGKQEEGIEPPLLFCVKFSRWFSTANITKRKAWWGEVRNGDRQEGWVVWARERDEIRNVSHCGMRMEFWHQFSWQRENHADCLIHNWKLNAAGDDGGVVGGGLVINHTYLWAMKKTLTGEWKRWMQRGMWENS